MTYTESEKSPLITEGIFYFVKIFSKKNWQG